MKLTLIILWQCGSILNNSSTLRMRWEIERERWEQSKSWGTIHNNRIKRRPQHNKVEGKNKFWRTVLWSLFMLYLSWAMTHVTKPHSNTLKCNKICEYIFSRNFSTYLFLFKVHGVKGTYWRLNFGLTFRDLSVYEFLMLTYKDYINYKG